MQRIPAAVRLLLTRSHWLKNCWQGGHEGGLNYAVGVAALADDSVVLTGQTNGDFAGAGSNVGGLDFVAIKLTAAGVEEWRWQVCKRLISDMLAATARLCQ